MAAPHLNFKLSFILVTLFILSAGCQVTSTTTQEIPPTGTSIPIPTSTNTPFTEPPTLPLDLTEIVITPTVNLDSEVLFGYTYQQPDGNRIVSGRGNLPGGIVLDVELKGTPAWVTAAPTNGNGSIWVVVHDDGLIQGFLILENQITPIDISPGDLPPGMPPLLMVDRGVPSLVTAPVSSASPLTHPIIVGTDPMRLAFVDIQGDLVLWENGEVGRLAIKSLLDARILKDENNRLLVLSGATNQYQHGVLGDAFEASALTLVETSPDLREIFTLEMPENKVVEGISPIWADLNGDGEREIVLTLSDGIIGAQVTLFSERGEIIATGPPIGRGFRWRHQLVVSRFGPENELSLVDLLTPHIGGIVEFYRWVEDRLEIRTQLSGFSTHRLGSRNLDMVLAGDLDGDDQIELLVPNQEMNALGGITFANATAMTKWSVDLEDTLNTNIAAVTLQDGSLGIGIGLKNNILKIWMP